MASPLSQMFDQNPGKTALGKMQPVDTSFQETAAPAAQVTPPQVDPMTKDNASTRGRATAWKNVQPGGTTFMSFDEQPQQAQPDSLRG